MSVASPASSTHTLIPTSPFPNGIEPLLSRLGVSHSTRTRGL